MDIVVILVIALPYSLLNDYTVNESNILCSSLVYIYIFFRLDQHPHATWLSSSSNQSSGKPWFLYSAVFHACASYTGTPSNKGTKANNRIDLIPVRSYGKLTSGLITNAPLWISKDQNIIHVPKDSEATSTQPKCATYKTLMSINWLAS